MVGGVQASDPNVSPGSGLNLVVRVPAVAVNNGSEKYSGCRSVARQQQDGADEKISG
jgi:hypothetical protein